ncbi:hypothetical protein PISL3812_06391 [Talaromyces islandicus]|uniref:Uncharacterized protein n=1 Tax=Talaromyces islandicus TaxID=28573 RepID=A0A0U1M186_TALIS|nr:hypothetical protein PISL3812_06391 [Talaromyces islandicus]
MDTTVGPEKLAKPLEIVLVFLVCAAKAVECHYPTSSKPKDPKPNIQHNHDDSPEQRKVSPSLVADFPGIENHEGTSTSGDILLDIPDPEFANFAERGLDWDYPDINFAEILRHQTNDEPIQNPSPEPSALVRLSEAQINRVQELAFSSNISMPMQPTGTPRSLTLRTGLKAGTQRTANLMLHMLKSYPLMMLRHKTLPPFIHPHVISFNDENLDMEPLNNCISLLHMISSGVRGSRKLFWRNVRLECERLCENIISLNKWELLASIQATAIYILIRLDEGETDYNNFDFLLLTTVTVLSKRFTNLKMNYTTHLEDYDYSLDSSWKNWILEESCRRVSVVFQTVNMLVYFEPAALCDQHTNLIFAPLPAKKQLWEAGDKFSWKAENDREYGAHNYFGLATNGDLIKLDWGHTYCGDASLLHQPLSNKTTANWEEWCSGMDGLGGLIMLAASLAA